MSLFYLHLWRLVSLDIEFIVDLFCFFFQHLESVIPLPSFVSEKSASSYIFISPIHNESFFFWSFHNFFLVFGFQEFGYHEFRCGSLYVYLIWGLLRFSVSFLFVSLKSNLGRFQPLFLQIFFLLLFFLFSSGTPINTCLDPYYYPASLWCSVHFPSSFLSISSLWIQSFLLICHEAYWLFYHLNSNVDLI